jgi:hypothetical protein
MMTTRLPREAWKYCVVLANLQTNRRLLFQRRDKQSATTVFAIAFGRPVPGRFSIVRESLLAQSFIAKSFKNLAFLIPRFAIPPISNISQESRLTFPW